MYFHYKYTACEFVITYWSKQQASSNLLCYVVTVYVVVGDIEHLVDEARAASVQISRDALLDVERQVLR